ncbi:MAG: SIS domain-containing protein, partial [bacterium]|nr:SIS domain-containing protein [bacterium]MDW8164614.1 SIS domain-containing protein [Candidatus Omnitrophota bacterium]
SILFKKGELKKEIFYKRCYEVLKVKEKMESFFQKNNIEEIADILINKTNALYLGKGINFPVALEGALKLKEVSYIHAEGYPSAEMKHGPIALIDENMPVIFICMEDRHLKKVISNMEEVKTRKGYIISICDFISDEIKRLSNKILSVPHIENEYLKPLLSSLPLQLLAYYVA